MTLLQLQETLLNPLLSEILTGRAILSSATLSSTSQPAFHPSGGGIGFKSTEPHHVILTVEFWMEPH